MLRVHVETAADAELSTTLDELVAEGARRRRCDSCELLLMASFSSLKGAPVRKRTKCV